MREDRRKWKVRRDALRAHDAAALVTAAASSDAVADSFRAHVLKPSRLLSDIIRRLQMPDSLRVLDS